jgi:membrane associated rhomboid family serine protease
MFEEFRNAFRRHNNSHVQLIYLNVIVFLVMGLLFVIATFSKTPAIFTSVYKQFTLPSDLMELATRPWTLFTYGFAHHFHLDETGAGRSHIDIMHIVFNMLGLYWFGRVFIEYLGSDKLVAVYILGVIAGGLLYLGLYNTIPMFMESRAELVGASAAVFAVMTAIAVLIPDYTFYLLLLGPVKVKYIAAFYIALSLLFSAVDNAGGNFAHLGGALIGFVYIKQLQAGNNWGGWITASLYWVKSLFREKRRVKVTYRNETFEEYRRPTSTKTTSTVSQAEIDAILDKINAGGYESLSKDEKEKLFNASRK